MCLQSRNLSFPAGQYHWQERAYAVPLALQKGVVDGDSSHVMVPAFQEALNTCNLQ